ncbi:hypothetical protein PUNSTDRAFT_130528 [Punctularia strigosozonata HHB-11173 SS5]|uniref:uncharacterized protein n=1 Tax=Punctularia strigosozonata (strain HHB-11173) TaxID=741275 RepID=UPI0004417AE1|nr:uncharacterized protein PUNSTDRAFT_130528 [Punctularia strigosozonata HHB-11173 SS5]EIN12261.1 hypothetical protein PUNSTDRAFT_130528 [Punctularia strigosozonata HHB-11173 SS5]
MNEIVAHRRIAPAISQPFFKSATSCTGGLLAPIFGRDDHDGHDGVYRESLTVPRAALHFVGSWTAQAFIGLSDLSRDPDAGDPAGRYGNKDGPEEWSMANVTFEHRSPDPLALAPNRSDAPPARSRTPPEPKNASTSDLPHVSPCVAIVGPSQTSSLIYIPIAWERRTYALLSFTEVKLRHKSQARTPDAIQSASEHGHLAFSPSRAPPPHTTSYTNISVMTPSPPLSRLPVVRQCYSTLSIVHRHGGPSFAHEESKTLRPKAPSPAMTSSSDLLGNGHEHCDDYAYPRTGQAFVERSLRETDDAVQNEQQEY